MYIYTHVCVYTWWDNFGYPTRQSHKWTQMFKCRVRSDWTARHLRQHWSCCTRAWTGAQVVGDPECGCLPEIPCVSFWAFSKMIRLQRFTWGLLMLLHVVTGAEFRLFFHGEIPARSGHTQVRKQRLAGRTGNMTEDKAHGIPDEQLKTNVIECLKA